MTDPISLIQTARKEGRKSLSEYESKQFLAAFGIPVCKEVIVKSSDEAAHEAEKMGFPVVLKASGAKLTHKTEAGAVVINLKSKEEVKKEGERLLSIEGCEALSVQEMVPGARELVCGLTRDPHFGPAVMFGLGGIFTEILKDTVFRIAPLEERDAFEMMDEIRARKILDPFRGEEAADRNILAKTLVAVGEIGLKYEDVAEIDINPLKIRPDGKLVAVDALVILT
ncbi:MAG: acetate--CoA ligase family protein [Syntrophales bacterium]|nr:acetate--CoA ligase family protein [Syntrophales bacterium]